VLCRWAFFPRSNEQWHRGASCVARLGDAQDVRIRTAGRPERAQDRSAGVFLTGYSLVEWELRALDRGATDFVDKARGIEVPTQRLRVIMEGQRQIPAAMTEVERHGELPLHPSMARALWRGQDVGLTIMEYKIVTLLVSGGLHGCRTMYDTMHYVGFFAGSGKRGYITNVRSIVKKMRRKFVAVDPAFSAIENVQNVGYRWVDRKH
jgi:two-component system, OmpR family, response regulator ChvI